MAGMSDAADMAKMGNMANMNKRTEVQQYYLVYQLHTLFLHLPDVLGNYRFLKIS